VSADSESVLILICQECRKASDEGAHGWRALLTVDDEVATSCPGCAEAEFDG
jgi:hypothetical protein